jgi:glycosyltransferase involved in cell wall biosynthesis
MSDAVLLPVYNEEPTVGSVLDAVRRYFHGDVLVVDDGSTDGGRGVLGEASTTYAVITHPYNLGYGGRLPRASRRPGPRV